MTVLLAWEDAVDIGHGRGRLAPDAAASLRRVDSAFGRAADVNEAWRSPQQADANYRAYVAYRAYLAGLGPKVPWAPLAYPATSSIHCRGYALDTDDTSTAQMRVWNDHGWFWTVYRNGVLVERWHLEYFRDRDNHRNEPAGGGATPIEEDDMYSDQDRARDAQTASDTAQIRADAAAIRAQLTSIEAKLDTLKLFVEHPVTGIAARVKIAHDFMRLKVDAIWKWSQGLPADQEAPFPAASSKLRDLVNREDSTP